VTKPSNFAVARLWSAFHPNLIGLFLGCVIVVIVCGFIYVPIGPSSQVIGFVDHMSMMPGRTRYYHLAYVRVDRREVVVRLPSYRQCETDGSIHLTKQNYIFRVVYSPDLPSCAVR